MQSDAWKSLINDAKLLKNKCKWIQATKKYRKAIELLLIEKNEQMVIELYEQIGFCYYRRAFQAKTNTKFKKFVKLSILTYTRILETITEPKNETTYVKYTHIQGFIAYLSSWIERNTNRKRDLLSKWWNLENHVLKKYENNEDLKAVGKTINDILEYNQYVRHYLWKSFFSRKKSIVSELINLGDKSIKILSKLDDDYELARAYCFSSWYHTWVDWIFESPRIRAQSYKKCANYAKKALEHALKTENPWLIGWSYVVCFNAAQMCDWNPVKGKEFGEKTLEYGIISKDNFLKGFGNLFVSMSSTDLAKLVEDPDKQKEELKRAIQLGKRAIDHFTIINEVQGTAVCTTFLIQSITSLAELESSNTKKYEILTDAKKIIKLGLRITKDLERLHGNFLRAWNLQLLELAKIKNDVKEQKKILLKALAYAKQYVNHVKKFYPISELYLRISYFQLTTTLIEIAKIENNLKKKTNLLVSAAKAIERPISIVKEKSKLDQSNWTIGLLGQYYNILGIILQKIYSHKKEETIFIKAIKAHENAITAFKKAEISAYTAESFWNIAQLQSQKGEHQGASQNYESASHAYTQAAEKIPQLKGFYKNHSLYMQAWSQIEQARYSHSIEEYEKARQHYEEAARLHESTGPWSYLAANYSAWASMEEAEGLSRKESTQQAKETFQKALGQFTTAEKSVKRKIGESTSPEEKEMVQKLLKASDLRQQFCQARIQIEDAKLLDKKGKYMQSSRNYSEVKQKLESIIENTESEAERKELELLATLCQAWQKMGEAEEKTSSESYLEAAELFEKAKDYCYTRKASLWALGNSNFCKGLAAGLRYKSSMDLKENAVAKHFIKDASSSYFEAGFKSASEYAKGTQRLFDAYAFMNQAENELDQEKRAKQYQMVENLLQLAAGSFMKAKQPEKATQVQNILANVKEEKALAISLSQVMQAPTIASSTLSFSAPSPTSEVSVGLEQFQHANVQANLIAGMKEVKVGESFCLTVEFVNAGKEPALLTRVEDFVPQDFVVVKKPEIYRLEESCLNMKGKQIEPLKLVEAKLVLQPSKKGVYHLKPIVHYLDELGQNKSLQLKSVEIKVEEVVLADRVSTGTKELDSLLTGGIPKEYAVVLTGSPSDEREHIIKNFLEAGVKEEQTSFYVTTESVGFEDLLEKPIFYLFLCNPKPKVEVPDLPNVSRLRSKTDLTNLNIALLKAYRNVEQSSNKRACVSIVSDVLVDHGVKTTRKWIAELTTDLVSKGFTTLAVINPEMHTSEQTGAVLDLFDGEISITQSDDSLECKKSIQVKKLRGQDYIKNPICLKRQT